MREILLAARREKEKASNEREKKSKEFAGG
jgi:hypothetical protein